MVSLRGVVEGAQQRGTKKKKGSAWPLFLFLGLFFSGVFGGAGWSCYRDHLVSEAFDRFAFPLQHGEMELAYAELTEERRRSMSQAEFEAYMDHPVLKKLEEADFYFPDQDPPGVCMTGRVPMPEGEWAVQLFFLKEDGQWRLHSIGLQRPAGAQLESILLECSFAEHKLMGYPGPRPEHLMPQTRGSW